ncbi:hypothetical protein OCU04_004859 [Sclerotinia nivalis]|uniref:Uncharacterized protein n=1 Tax=Sclerotinia nivalis TaxID=352851 RepID=A0A9X0DL25_9HELO|nr:hypothetical protein OCU04_004859 [Sclerotinia nivalis]
MFGGALYHFWGGWYFDRVAFFIDLKGAGGSCTDTRVTNGQTGQKEGVGRNREEEIWYRIQALISDHKNDRRFMSRLEVDPLDIVLRGSRASDTSFRRAVKSALIDVFDWNTNIDIEDRISIRGVKQENTNLKDAMYVSAFGAARVAKMQIDKPKPLGCNAEEVQCTRLTEKALEKSLRRRKPEEKEEEKEAKGEL